MTNHVESRLRFAQMRMLLALANAQTVRGAATALHLSQSAVSKALLDVEGALGASLFTRTGRGLIPTEAGQLAIRHARLILNDLTQMQQQIASSQNGQGATLRIGVVPFLSNALLPEVFATYRARGRGRIKHYEERTPQLIQLLTEGDVDIILTTYTGDTLISLPSPEFTHEPMLNEEVVVFVARSHRLAVRRELAWAELVSEPWVLPAAPSLLRDSLDSFLSLSGLPPLTPTIESSSITACVEFVCRDLGIGVGPRSVLGQALSHQRVAILPVKPPCDANVASFVRTSMIEHPEIRAFRESAEELLTRLAMERAMRER